MPHTNPIELNVSDMVKFESCPRLLHAGLPKFPGEIQDLFKGYYPKLSTQIESYGFGEEKECEGYFHTHVPAPNQSYPFTRRCLLRNPISKGQDYAFDMVSIDLPSYRSSDRSFFSIYGEIWRDCLSFLKPGGLVLVWGEYFDHMEEIGSYAFRLERWHLHRLSNGQFLLLGEKRAYPSSNIKAKRLMYQFMYGKPLDEGPAALSLLPPKNLPYVVSRGMEHPPTAMSKSFAPWYIADRITKSDVLRPFEGIRKYLAIKGENPMIRIPLTPTPGNLAKLATLADGLIVDEHNNQWVVKGKPETHESKIEDEDGAVKRYREVKRLKLSALQMDGIEPGRLINSQLG